VTSQTGQAALIMAAGKSTRMKSRLPKAAHLMCGRPMGRHVIEACQAAGIQRIVVVVGHEAEAVKQALGSDVEYVLQTEQLGTGHAVLSAEPLLQDFNGTLAVFPADAPLVRPETIAQMMQTCESGGSSATLLTAELPDAGMYGRIVRDSSGAVKGIVEAKDASPEIRAIREICTSIYAFKTADLLPALHHLSPENRQKEYYLTDVIGMFVQDGKKVDAWVVDDPDEVLGINTRVELANATAILRTRILREHMLAGVTMIDPSSVYIDVGVTIGRDTVIYPGTVIEGTCEIGEACTLGPNTRIVRSTLAAGVTVEYSVLVESEVGQETRVGPFARLRPGSRVGCRVNVGDFVEIKNSSVGDEVSVAHLSYLGDAEVGARTNIGAGTITCNYDGRRKHHTKIGSEAFVGSHTTLNAPVEVGNGAFIASGSVICEDVPADALAIARCRQTNKEEWAKRRRQAAEGQK